MLMRVQRSENHTHTWEKQNPLLSKVLSSPTDPLGLQGISTPIHFHNKKTPCPVGDGEGDSCPEWGLSWNRYNVILKCQLHHHHHERFWDLHPKLIYHLTVRSFGITLLLAGFIGLWSPARKHVTVPLTIIGLFNMHGKAIEFCVA